MHSLIYHGSLSRGTYWLATKVQLYPQAFPPPVALGRSGLTSRPGSLMTSGSRCRDGAHLDLVRFRWTLTRSCRSEMQKPSCSNSILESRVSGSLISILLP